MDWCEQHGYKYIVLEIDSELVYKWIDKMSNIPWRYQQLVQDILQIVNKMKHFQFPNTTTDLLAKFSHSLEIPQHFYVSQQLKGTIRGSYIVEKMGIYNFRRRKIKRIKYPP